MPKLLSNPWRRSRRWIYPLISATLALFLVVGQPLAGQAISWGDLILRGIQVIQLSNLSDRQEVELGQQINQELVSRQVRLYRNPDVVNYINDIGQRLAAQSTRPRIPYTFQVVDDPQVNAFATMGGFVYINTGLIRAADNEAELASVIGHEIAHISERHSVKQMRELAIARGVIGAIGKDRSLAVNLGVELALRRPHSREAEFEADLRGLQMLQKANYAPSGMVSFMRKLLRSGGGSVPTFLSTHPATSDRITRLERLIDDSNVRIGQGLDESSYRSRIRTLL